MKTGKSIKVLTVFGTRPEVIKCFPVLRELQENESFESIVVSTAQHREMIEDLLRLFSIKPDHDLNVIQPNQSLVDISTRVMARLDPVLKQHQPDLVLVQGDTTTAFIGALAAFFHKIPVGHVEAGLRSFDKMQPYLEEINRRLISTVGDLHFAPTVENAQNLHEEGIDDSKVFVTGNTVIDSLLHVAARNSGKLNSYLRPQDFESRRLILVTAHRRENWGKPLENLCNALKDLVQLHQDIEVVYPVHLNPNVRKIAFPILSNQERIHLLDPLPYEPFVEAMAQAHLIITDSRGIQEEGPSLKKPILVFRSVTERNEGIGAGGVKLIGLKRQNVVSEVSRLLEDDAACRQMVATHNPYGDGEAGARVVQAILHYFERTDRPEGFVVDEELQRRSNANVYITASK